MVVWHRFAQGIQLAGDGWQGKLLVLEPQIFRVLLYKNDTCLPQVHTVSWAETDTPPEGHRRDTAFGRFSYPDFTLEETPEGIAVFTSRLCARLRLEDFAISWFIWRQGEWRPLMQDRPTGAYNFTGRYGPGMRHYVQRNRQDVHFGLGEKTGDVVKTGRRYRMANIDCMGYDARRSDPLYKHLPYTLCHGEQGWYALYYDTPAECQMDLGCELDNYHGLYQYFQADCEYLDYYMFGGEAPSDIVPAFAQLGGIPLMPPFWSLGYLGSAMQYTDGPAPVEDLQGFAARCREYGIPCTGFHLSSGYTSIGERRYVFHWNREKFPDIAGFAQGMKENGIQVVANIKPCLLVDHPLYSQCREQGLFVTNPDGSPALSRFWDGDGSWLDFTNPAALGWWHQQVTEQILAYGLETWNDNNEFEIWDTAVQCIGSNGETTAAALRPMMTLQMLRTSYNAQVGANPSKRPFMVSRAGCLGLQRFAQTWTGDNYTCWETLRYNHKMGLGLSLSGIYNFGHDVGGFAGPKPSPELFLRWMQHGVFMPRFCIHSWNEDGSVNEPWMYPQLMPAIQQLMRLRTRIMPQLYHLLYQAHTHYQPIVRPVFYEFGGADYESDLYLLGREMLVANVFDEGVTCISVHLPAGTGWYVYGESRFFEGGQAVEMDACLEAPVAVFVREGSMLLAGESGGQVVELYLPAQGTLEERFLWDDGESVLHSGAAQYVRVKAQCADNLVQVHAEGCQHLRLRVYDFWNRPVEILGDAVLEGGGIIADNR